ncbi:MAG TPA: hypothetical protein VF530_23385 [Planctomycetota bacterium]
MMLAVLGTVASCGETNVSKAVGKSLRLTAPTDQDVTQGNTEVFKVKVDRNDFGGPISLEFSKLPNGVTITGDKNIPAGYDNREFSITAKDSAMVEEEHPVSVTAQGDGLPPVSVTFNVRVKARDR